MTHDEKTAGNIVIEGFEFEEQENPVAHGAGELIKGCVITQRCIMNMMMVVMMIM